ncbi:TlpA family protein disulfide reductase [Winogradskyella psychrotolerans]|uniref:TlpA family protein disulfide reductase n=1 Tax=Winogradskyella psychrotolerans TaxID=1344585 RepID=UPI001C074E51|nr:TlpA disulfide reductase family protein [Winogradskyella psychrotolerans]MBU2929915.1 TlpA family protein disulfide reductase [Winogradskyella psychrotolerans]
MKRLLLPCIAVTLFACKGEPKDYVTLSGKIANPDESKTLKIFNRRNYEKAITLNDDGTFKDTLKLEAGDYNFQHGKEYGQIYLENDNETSFETDYNSFIDSMVFKGDASDLNNFSVQSFLISKTYFTEQLVGISDMEKVNEAITNYKSAYDDLKNKYSEVDSSHIAIMDRNINMSVEQITKFMERKIATLSAFPKGSPSPVFENYENYAGGTTSLSDLKGKYVYIDLWATWCGPCIKEIPSLKKVEKQYEGKNIEFVSISLDEGRSYKGDAEEAYKGWKKMINEKELGGMQLIADNGFESQFIRDYKVNGIPRFILIDPDGNIVSSDAPRPSTSALVELFNELNI